MNKNATGKIEYIKSLLIKGGKTRPQIHEIASRKFPGLGKQTVDWCASKLGRKSKHLPHPRKPRTVKPKVKVPARRK